jgi:hypothetical protein
VLVKAGNSEGFGGAWRITGAGGDEAVRIAGGGPGATCRIDAVARTLMEFMAVETFSTTGTTGNTGTGSRFTGLGSEPHKLSVARGGAGKFFCGIVETLYVQVGNWVTIVSKT